MSQQAESTNRCADVMLHSDNQTMRYLLLALALLLPGTVVAQQTPVPGRSADVVVTVGEGVVQVVPDRAWITISAESRASNAREAQRRNAEAMRAVQDKVRATGIAADAIRTVAYDLQYEWDFVDGRRVGRGYVARNSIEVRVDAVDQMGDLLEVAVGAGAAAVSGIRFDVKDRVRREREALRLAVSDARAKAEAAASAANRVVDRIVRIQEQGAADPEPLVRTFAMREAAQAGGAPPIAAGQIELRAQVTVTAALQ
jgi:uncharacterized protein YggE